ncbi:MAG: hypothetical protein WCI04_02850 [archaeon]
MANVKKRIKKKVSKKVLASHSKKSKTFTQKELALASRPLIIGSPTNQGNSRTLQEDHLMESLNKPIESLIEATDRLKKSTKKIMFETELRNPLLRTDFDRVLRIIENAGIISSGKIRTELKMENVHLKACYESLQRAGKIRIEYPLFGSPSLISIAFEKEKKRRGLIRLGINPDDEIE